MKLNGALDVKKSAKQVVLRVGAGAVKIVGIGGPACR